MTHLNGLCMLSLSALAFSTVKVLVGGDKNGGGRESSKIYNYLQKQGTGGGGGSRGKKNREIMCVCEREREREREKAEEGGGFRQTERECFNSANCNGIYGTTGSLFATNVAHFCLVWIIGSFIFSGPRWNLDLHNTCQDIRGILIQSRTIPHVFFPNCVSVFTSI